jgi:hypothetical protein
VWALLVPGVPDTTSGRTSSSAEPVIKVLPCAVVVNAAVNKLVKAHGLVRGYDPLIVRVLDLAVDDPNVMAAVVWASNSKISLYRSDHN